MRCSKCESDNSAGKRFCGDCGSPLTNRCPKCGADSPLGKRFCSNCGSALAVESTNAELPAHFPNTPDIVVTAEQMASAIEGERKTITALFADIKGSTELMRDLDPEEARAIIDPVLQLMMDAVHRYDGYVAQSTGDGIFAMFGAPVAHEDAHEDHPQRALRAALMIQQELQQQGERLKNRGRPTVEARIGVNTGEVVLRMIHTGGHTEYSPVGHATNLAARMQTIARAGGITITEECRRLVEGYFSLRELGPTEIKGISQLVNVYEVIGPGPLRGHFELAARRGLTRFVGRERELAELQRALDLAMGARGQIVAVVADAGAGKSGLFHEFKAMLPSSCKVLEAYSVSHGKASAWLPVLELLRDYFGFLDKDDPETRREKVRTALEALDPALASTLPYLFGLLGVQEAPDTLAQMHPEVKQRRTLDAIKRIVVSESLRQPTIVIFEDLHWVDSRTQEVLDLLVDSITSARALLLVNYRPEYRHEWSNRSHYSQLRLEVLGRDGAQQMLSALLGDGAELAQLRGLVIDRTDGNPFFIEEMVQALFDEGVIVRNGAAKIARPLSQLQLPPTVQGILAARIDRLAPAQKDLLQTLAVTGRESPLELIRKIVARSDSELAQLLTALQMGEFIYEHPVPGGTEYTFKHALTQEVAYNSLLIERRKLLHELVGQAIESVFAGRLDDYLAGLARHYSRSGNVRKAVEYLTHAGQQAVERSAYGDGIATLTTALDQVAKLPEGPERIQRELLLQLGLGTVLIPAKGWAAPEVPKAFRRVQELAEQLGNTALVFRALVGLWSVHQIRGDMRAAYGFAEQALRIAQSTQDSIQLLLAHVAMGGALLGKGEFLLSRGHAEAAISLYQPERHGPWILRASVDMKVICLANLGIVLWALGYPDEGLKRANEAVVFARGLPHPHSAANAELLLAVVHQCRREAGAAQQTADRLSELCAEHGFTMWSALAKAVRGWAIAEQGHHEEGIAQIEEGIAAYQATGADYGTANYLNHLARICMGLGNLDKASTALSEATALQDVGQDNISERGETIRLKGELLMRQHPPNAAEAQSCFERAIEIARDQKAKSFELRALTSFARHFAAQDRQAEARAMLAETYGWFTEGLDTADLKDANVMLEQLKA